MANCNNPACRKCSIPPRCPAGPRCHTCYPERGPQPKTKYERDLERTRKQAKATK